MVDLWILNITDLSIYFIWLLSLEDNVYAYSVLTCLQLSVYLEPESVDDLAEQEQRQNPECAEDPLEEGFQIGPEHLTRLRDEEQHDVTQPRQQ